VGAEPTLDRDTLEGAARRAIALLQKRHARSDSDIERVTLALAVQTLERGLKAEGK
jgi:hypothetical protein